MKSLNEGQRINFDVGADKKGKGPKREPRDHR